MKHKFVLASASPRRKELLAKLLQHFRVVNSRIDESNIRADSPLQFAMKAARAKAKAVAAKYKYAVVIGADTVVVLEKKVLGKPKDHDEAIAMLKSLAGKTHKVITGIAVILPCQKIISDSAVTKVTMKAISDQEILDYVKTGSPLDKAGAYGIQEIEEIFIDRIEGDYDNVVGLPLFALQKILSRKIKL